MGSKSTVDVGASVDEKSNTIVVTIQGSVMNRKKSARGSIDMPCRSGYREVDEDRILLER